MNLTLIFCLCVLRPTFWRICKAKNVEEFKPDPYLATLMNCLLWFFYGLPIVHPNSTLVLTINGIGLVIEGAYIIIFIIYAAKNTRVPTCHPPNAPHPAYCLFSALVSVPAPVSPSCAPPHAGPAYPLPLPRRTLSPGEPRVGSRTLPGSAGVPAALPSSPGSLLSAHGGCRFPFKRVLSD